MVRVGEDAVFDLDVAPDWRRDAACAGIRAINFFPERGESAAGAKAICAMCPVRPPCLEFALRINVSAGIWGGLSGRERRQLARARRLHSQHA
jgi:WhiB family redox-sensing transcriptional regulator